MGGLTTFFMTQSHGAGDAHLALSQSENQHRCRRQSHTGGQLLCLATSAVMPIPVCANRRNSVFNLTFQPPKNK